MGKTSQIFVDERPKLLETPETWSWHSQFMFVQTHSADVYVLISPSNFVVIALTIRVSSKAGIGAWVEVV